MQNAKMSEYTDNEYTMYGSGLDKFLDERDEKRGYHHIRGIVRHDLGDMIFSQYKEWHTEYRLSANKERRFLNIEINCYRKIYSRQWKGWYGEKTIARLANEFIEEIKDIKMA